MCGLTPVTVADFVLVMSKGEDEYIWNILMWLQVVSIHRIPGQQAINQMALTCVWQGQIGRSCKVHHPRPQGADTRGAARREIGVTHQSHLRPFEPQVSALSSKVSSLAVHSLQSRLGSPAVTVCSSSNNCWLTSLDRSNRSNWAQGCIKWNIHPCVAHIIS